jgi:hypothetical protein
MEVYAVSLSLYICMYVCMYVCMYMRLYICGIEDARCNAPLRHSAPGPVESLSEPPSQRRCRGCLGTPSQRDPLSEGVSRAGVQRLSEPLSRRAWGRRCSLSRQEEGTRGGDKRGRREGGTRGGTRGGGREGDERGGDIARVCTHIHARARTHTHAHTRAHNHTPGEPPESCDIRGGRGRGVDTEVTGGATGSHGGLRGPPPGA